MSPIRMEFKVTPSPLDSGPFADKQNGKSITIQSAYLLASATSLSFSSMHLFVYSQLAQLAR